MTQPLLIISLKTVVHVLQVAKLDIGLLSQDDHTINFPKKVKAKKVKTSIATRVSKAKSTRL
jgi:hypothetical protein